MSALEGGKFVLFSENNFYVFFSKFSEYLSRVFDDSSDLDQTPDEVKVKHIIHACELALDVREKDQGRRSFMMS